VEICKKISRECGVFFIIWRFPFPDDRNTVHGPAVAEEHAFAEDTCYLLLGDGGKQILLNNEAIFANDVVTHGDTRGENKFIRVQASIIGPNSIACIINLVVQLPDIVLYLSHYDIMTHSHFDT
jgi:hypothetical protein